MKITAPFLVFIMFMLFANSAMATNHVYTLNFKYDYEYRDYAIGDYYVDNNSLVDAAGIYARIYNQSGSVVWQGYTSIYGSAQVTLNDSQLYDIQLLAKTYLNNNNYVHVRFSVDSQLLHSQWVWTEWAPPSSAPFSKTFVYDYNDDWNASNVLAASGYALNHATAGLTGEVFTYFTEPCGGDEGSCFRNDTDPISIQIGDIGRLRKFAIVHELGHNIEYYITGDFTNDCSRCGYNESDEECHSDCGVYSSHWFHSKENASCAATESLANFYAAATWNEVSDGDCFYPKNDYNSFDCNGYDKYLEIDCDDWPSGAPLAGYGVESDWIQFWWNMHDTTCGESLSIGDIFHIYDGANPGSWDSMVAYTPLRISALVYGVTSSHWDTCADNAGINHPNQ